MTENPATPVGESTYTEPELVALIARGKGQFLEFAPAWDRGDDGSRPLERRLLGNQIAEAVAAFANGDGGLLLVGVDEDGTPSGHGYSESEIAELLAAPRERLRHRVECSATRTRVRGQEVLVFDTSCASEAVMVEGNGFPLRFIGCLTFASQETIEARKRASRHIDYERRICPEATLDSLDLGAARRFMERTPLQDEPVRDALEHYALARGGSEGWEITNAALLLFGRREGVRWHPRADLRLFRVSGAEERRGFGHFTRVLAVLRPPVLTALREARPFVEAELRRRAHRNGSDRGDGVQIPPAAWGEALVNAVAHCDYEDENRGVEVWFHEDRVEIRSPGGVVPPASEAMLREGRSTHAARNPVLVSALTDAGFMRDEGEGLARIRDEMAAKSLPPPEIAVEDGLFVIRLFHRRNEGDAAPPRPAPTGDES